MTKYPARLFWGVILVAFGVLMLLDRFELLDFSTLFRTWWPVLIVGFGAWIIFGGNRNERSAPSPAPIGGENIRTASSSDTVDESTVFGDVTVAVKANAFSGGEVSAVFGNCSVDLSGATLGSGQHKLEVDTVFGNVSLFVPASMPVEVDADAVLGSVTVNGEKSGGILREKKWTAGGYGAASTRLRVEVSAVMGDVTVTSVVR